MGKEFTRGPMVDFTMEVSKTANSMAKVNIRILAAKYNMVYGKMVKK